MISLAKILLIWYVFFEPFIWFFLPFHFQKQLLFHQQLKQYPLL